MTGAKSNVNVRIDAKVKERATGILSRMGIDQTTAIDMFYRQIIFEEGLPFQPKAKELSIDEQIIEAIKKKNIPSVTLETDENGNLLNFDELPENVKDWLVNG